MTWPSFTTKQLLTAVLLVCIGMGGISYSLHADFYERGFLETAASVLGMVGIFVGVILLATKRRRLRTLALALCGTIPGGFLGGLIAEIIAPPRHFKGQTTGEWFLADWMIYAGIALGALLTPLVVNWIRSADRRFVEGVEQDGER
jgi:hypothetical protein